MKKKKITFPKILLCLLGLILVFVIGFILVLTITEYRPKDTEELSLEGKSSKTLHEGESFHIMTWNIGYCGLGETADFFMDGGENVRSGDKTTVTDNMAAITQRIQQQNPEIIFLQEVDVSSKRSFYVDELEGISAGLTGYRSCFAPNYKVLYVPYPFPTIGKVNCGIATFTSYDVDEASREALPCPFSYPIRLANLKRCLMVSRLPIEDSDKELVLVNLHLEAYDDGEGKAAQTAQLRELLEKEAAKGNYVIAGGDFNQSFSNCDTSAYPLISEDVWTPGEIDVSEFDDSLSFVTDPSVPSCRSLDRPLSGNDSAYDKFQYYVIDGFIVSENIAVNSVETKNFHFENTDHNPIVMDVSLLP